MIPRLFAVSAATPAELEKATDEFARQLASGSDGPGGPPATMPYRRVVVSDSAAEAAAQLLDGATKDVFTAEATSGRPIVFMFSGVGDQYPGMAAGLYRYLPTYRQELDRCLRILEPELGLDLRALLFASAPPGTRRPDLAGLFAQRRSTQGIHQTLAAQPLAFATQYAMAQSMLSLGVRPQALVGYSLGDHVAGCFAGVLSLDDALNLTALRARLASAQPEGAMLAVMSAPGPLGPFLGHDVSVAALNGPELTVLAGPVDAIERIGLVLRDREIACRRLPTSHAFHSPMMDPVVGPLRDAFAKVSLNPPSLPLLSNVTGTWLTDQDAIDPEYWARHSRAPIRFGDDLDQVWRLPDPILVELGPGQTLINLAVRHPALRRRARQLVLPTLPGVFESRTDLGLFLTTVGRLWAAGTDIDWPAVAFEERV